MATSYPSGLDSYTTLTDNSDDVLAAHANDRGDAIEAIEAKLGINSSAVNTTIDYFLKHASGAYRTHTHDGSSDDGANIPANNIVNFNLAGSPTNKQVIRYNSSSGDWENATENISDLGDVTISSIADKNFLKYSSASGKWLNVLVNVVDLNDMNVSSPTNRQALTYNSSSGKYENLYPYAVYG